MRFHELIIKNWRSFLGTHSVKFADGDSRNITILIGQKRCWKDSVAQRIHMGSF